MAGPRVECLRLLGIRDCRMPYALQQSLMDFSNAEEQGLTLVHFSAQRKRFLWDSGCT
jgi:hypothetical protein